MSSILINICLVKMFRNSHKTRIEIIVLHSTSDSLQRSLVFRKAQPITRKIILATNIAESSITVPDVKYGETLFFRLHSMSNESNIELIIFSA